MNIQEILARLKIPIPAKYISHKPTFSKGKKAGEVDYINKYDYFQLLDERVGLDVWEIELSDPITNGEYVCVRCRITLHGSDRSITRSAIGSEELLKGGYGTPIDRAESSAIRRCCAALGLSRELWLEKPKSFKQPTNIASKRPPGWTPREERR